MAAALAIVTAMTGWLFARSPLVDVGPPLEWHRWLGVACAVAATVAALLSSPLYVSSRRAAFVYRFMLFVTALLVVVTAHLGGALVWGAGFLRP